MIKLALEKNLIVTTDKCYFTTLSVVYNYVTHWSRSITISPAY